MVRVHAGSMHNTNHSGRARLRALHRHGDAAHRALASATADIALYVVLGLLWPFAAAGAVVFGLIWLWSSGRSRGRGG
jgi:hypothetical protein